MRALAFSAVALSLAVLSGCTLYEDQTLYDFAKMEPVALQREDTLYVDIGTTAGRPYLTKGWWTDDEKDNYGRTFVWGTETRAEMTFGVTEVQDLEAVVNCRPVKGPQAQTIQFDVNEQPLGKPLQMGSEFGDYRIFIPSRVLKIGRNALGFSFAYADRPGEAQALGPNPGADPNAPSLPGGPQPSDVRRLSVCFDSVLFAPYNLQERVMKMASRGTEPLYVAELRQQGHEVIVQRLPGERAFFLRIPDRAELTFQCGFAPEDWKAIEGGEFRVTMTIDGQDPQVLYSQYLDPRKRRSHRKLIRKSVDLEKWAGQIAAFTLSVKAGYEKVAYPTYGIWVEPKIYHRSYVWGKKQPVLAQQAESPAIGELRSRLRSSSVAIILLDAASASHLGCYGYHLPTTPNLDRIAAEGVQFMNAYCQAVYTRASTGSLMTGEYPDLHRVLFARDGLPDTALTIAETFTAGGFRTGGFIGNPHAGENAGYRQGFADYVEMFRMPGYRNLAGDFLPHLIPWFEKNKERRFFAYIHFREPHWISDPPREYLAKFATGYKGKIDPQADRDKINLGRVEMDQGALEHIVSVYDATLNYADGVVGTLYDDLKRRGILDKTILIILADHGEALWEHGYFGHNTRVHENMAHIPLIMQFPAGIGVPQPRKIQGLTQTIDLPATFADVFGNEELKKRAAGRSLLPVLAGEPDPGAEFVFTRTLPGSARFGVRSGRWEYAYRPRTGDQELYDLWTDRLERRNLASERPVLAGFLQQQLRAWMRDQEALAAVAAAPAAATLDAETRRNLQALGYLDAGDGVEEVER
ncbi:MAG: sulfatase [Acidobacteriota bacterium]